MGCTSSTQKPIFDDVLNTNTNTNINQLENKDLVDLTNQVEIGIQKIKRKKYTIKSNFEYKQINKFSLENIKGNFYVSSVYDGDTITILVPMKISIYSNITEDFIDNTTNLNNTNKICNYEIKLRLYGIDTPELKPLKSTPNREAHITKAIKAKEFLQNIILNKVVQIYFVNNDKYGRALGIIFVNGININDLMVTEGYAKQYDGGTKNNNF